MPDIVPTAPFTDGSAANADTFAEELYQPLNPPGSMEVINGRLDEVNLAAGQNLDRRDVRPGTFTTANSVGATATVDYFSDFFNLDTSSVDPMGATYDADITGTSLIPFHVPIPGAGQSFYLYYDSVVFLSWEVRLETLSTLADAAGDTSAKNDSISLRLFVDGKTVDGGNDLNNFRRQLRTLGGSGGTSQRSFAGHCVLTPADFPSFTSEGWHTAGIYIVHQQYQIRVTTRRFNVVALKA